MTPDQAFDALQPHLNAWGASSRNGKAEVMKILRDTAMTQAELEAWLKTQESTKPEEPPALNKLPPQSSKEPTWTA